VDRDASRSSSKSGAMLSPVTPFQSTLALFAVLRLTSHPEEARSAVVSRVSDPFLGWA
jgi:hypothetical protein